MPHKAGNANKPVGPALEGQAQLEQANTNTTFPHHRLHPRDRSLFHDVLHHQLLGTGTTFSWIDTCGAGTTFSTAARHFFEGQAQHEQANTDATFHMVMFCEFLHTFHKQER